MDRMDVICDDIDECVGLPDITFINPSSDLDCYGGLPMSAFHVTEGVLTGLGAADARLEATG